MWNVTLYVDPADLVRWRELAERLGMTLDEMVEAAVLQAFGGGRKSRKAKRPLAKGGKK